MTAAHDVETGGLSDDPHHDAAAHLGHDHADDLHDGEDHPPGEHFHGAHPQHGALTAAEDLSHNAITDGAAGVFGTPNQDRLNFRPQTTDFTCDLLAQLQIFESLTGQHIVEAHGATDAAAHGFLTSDGTLPEHMSKLLELYGVPCHENVNGTFLDVIKELRDGHKVIVGVHSDGLWRSNDHLDAFANQAADHAIWVTGVDARDPHHIKVIINDSGKPDGGGNVYDLHELEDVLNCPGFHYVATGANAPSLPEDPDGYDEEHHVFSALDQFLHDHGMAVAVAGGLGVAASAGLIMARLNTRRSPERTMEENWAERPATPAIGMRPAPLLLTDETREARDRALRDL